MIAPSSFVGLLPGVRGKSGKTYMPENAETEPKIWCAVRRDLMMPIPRMPIPKMVVQAAHAFEDALWSVPRDIAERYREGSHVKILVWVSDEAELVRMHALCKVAGVPSSLVVDEGRTVFSEPTTTAMAVGPCRRDELPSKFRRLRMIKDDWTIHGTTDPSPSR